MESYLLTIFLQVRVIRNECNNAQSMLLYLIKMTAWLSYLSEGTKYRADGVDGLPEMERS